MDVNEQRGLRRRADKLRFIAWANLLACVAAGLIVDFGDAALRWTAAAVWSLLFLAVCYARARQMDRDGPVQRREP
jgi:hypothetical protein